MSIPIIYSGAQISETTIKIWYLKIEKNLQINWNF